MRRRLERTALISDKSPILDRESHLRLVGAGLHSHSIGLFPGPIAAQLVSPQSRGQRSQSAVADGAVGGPSAVLATALETILPDRDVCCGKDSGLEDAVLSAPSSLKELSAKLQGRHVLGDGLSIVVRAEYFPKNSIDPSLTIQRLMNQQPMLLQWKSHIYVLYGATYDETRYYNGGSLFVVHKLWLLDPRYSDRRRETELIATDDWTKIQGILALSVVRK